MIFPPDPAPRVFACPPGADFPTELAAGLDARLAPLPPEARARVTLIVNSGRMRRALRARLAGGAPALLPRIRLITEPLALPGAAALAPPMPPLRRRLELAQLVDRLLNSAPDLAPRAALYDLSDSLARLFAEMQAEGVSIAALRALDVSNHSAHWQRTLAFIDLAERVLRADSPDIEGRLRAQAEALVAHWADAPPPDPILIAGSTGSRGTTALLMQAVARLPQGAVILPGFDFDMPPHAWDAVADAEGAEDHPQYRFLALMQALGRAPDAPQPWTATAAPAPARNRLVSLALRPAPITDQWMQEGAGLGDLRAATARLSLLEAASPRDEATAIALRLAQAARDGQRAALITPDRDLTRRVTAALDAWRITPDDSAGRPLALSAPGRFLRQVAALMAQRLDAQGLLALLKHPLCHVGDGRGAHLLHTRDLELRLRRKGVAFPDAAWLRRFGGAQGCSAWADWLSATLPPAPAPAPQPLAAHVAQHLALAERLSRADAGAPDELWAQAAGQVARRAMSRLAQEAAHGLALSPRDYEAFVTAYLQGFDVRDPVAAHPGIMIWGTLEARVQGADLVIMAGLNEGVWPKAPEPDPWLNRRMRRDAGLLLPERQIGLSAHDFQQAIGAPEVMLSRALRSAEAQTVPSRWLNRLINLLGGLKDQHGDAALAAMLARGAHWGAMAAAFESDHRHTPRDLPAPRPAPAPPVSARPRELPVTGINRLIRDPYAIYARYVLGLRPLGPLAPRPDAALQGMILHDVLEHFTRAAPEPDPEAQILRLLHATLARDVPWPAARALLAARAGRMARAFLRFHLAQPGRVILLEDPGGIDLRDPAFRLTARPDRIDEWPDGEVHIIDYKTGTPPSHKEQAHYDKQLLLQAVIASEGGFNALGPRDVARITYLGLGAGGKAVETDLDAGAIATARSQLDELITAYLEPARGFAARRAVQREGVEGDYDHLARFGEWTQVDEPQLIIVGADAV